MKSKEVLWCGGMRAGWKEAETLLLCSSLFVLFNCLCPGRWLISSVSSIDGCMNAPQPLKVIFVVFFPQVVSALESNPTARRTQLHHKFEQVIALVEDNIYECCSEA